MQKKEKLEEVEDCDCLQGIENVSWKEESREEREGCAGERVFPRENNQKIERRGRKKEILKCFFHPLLMSPGSGREPIY